MKIREFCDKISAVRTSYKDSFTRINQIAEDTEMIKTNPPTKGKLEEIYGRIPSPPEHLDVADNSADPSFAAGRAVYSKYSLICHKDWGVFTFPAVGAMLKAEGKHPVIIHINQYEDLPNRYTPCEEILDMGYSVLSFCADKIFLTDTGKPSGAGGILGRRGKRSSPGHLALYAWCAMRIVDHLLTLDNVDGNRIYVAGHGALAEAALLACAYDGRIKAVIANGLAGISSADGELYCRGYLGGECECERIIRLCKYICARQVLVSFADGDMIFGNTEALGKSERVTARRREGGSYFTRGDWQFYCSELQSGAVCPDPC